MVEDREAARERMAIWNIHHVPRHPNWWEAVREQQVVQQTGITSGEQGANWR
jgi:hypothetical protein